MNTNFNQLKKSIVRLTSIGQLQDDWKKTNDEIIELETQLAKLKEEFPDEAFDEDVFTTSININKMKLNDLNIQLKNLINIGDDSCMIFLKDNSRFIVNFDTITYLREHQFIDDDLYNTMINEEETYQECVQSTGNELISYFSIIKRYRKNIVIKDLCSTEDEIIQLNKYLLPENIFKMLLCEYDCLTSVNYDNISLVYNVAKPTNKIMNLVLNELDRLKDRDVTLNYMFVVKTICQPSEKTVCRSVKLSSSSSSSSSKSQRRKTSMVARENIFGWILEPSKHSKRVFFFFKIIKGVLYTFNTQLYKSTQYKYNYSINDTSFSITSTDKNINTETGETEETITPIVTIEEGKIRLDNIPDFGKKTLKDDKITEDDYKYDKYTTHNISKIQIYEINGELNQQRYIEIQPRIFDLVREFKLTEETMKDILHSVTHIDKESIQIDCTLPIHCPIHNPYFCPKNSAFRNNIRKKTLFRKEKITPSKGNNSQCVPDMELCDLSYEAAELSLINQYHENKKVAPRNYFSKPKYCKIDTYLGNKQMIETFEGGSVNSYIKGNRRYSKRKR